MASYSASHNDDRTPQVVFPRYNSLYKSLRQDPQLTCLVLTVAIYSCSLAVITWPTGYHDDCRQVTSRHSNADAERVPWTGRSFNDDRGLISSSSSSSHVKRDIVKSFRVEKCQEGSTGDVASTLTMTWFSLIAVVYLVYVVECWFSPYRRRFADKQRRVVDTQTAYDLVTSLQNSLPVVRWTAVSYHYIRSTVATASATTPLRHDKPRKQRIVTHRDSTLYHYAPDDLLDCSPPLVDLEAFPVTWLQISCQFSFGSAAARRDFARQRDAFYCANRARDRHVDFRQTLSLLATSGSANTAWSRDLAVYNPDARPWYASVTVYWVASLLTLSWPLRLVIQWRTATVDYAVHKMFDHRRDDVSSDVYDDVISVTSLEESSASSSSCISADSFSSATWSTLADTCLIPSYSQALLMDSRTITDHQKTGHCQQYAQWRHGRYSSQLRRAQSCITVVQRDDDDDDDDVIYDVKPSPSLATHLCKPDRRAAILMTSRPPSYHTAMCHVTAHRPALAQRNSDHVGYGATAT